MLLLSLIVHKNEGDCVVLWHVEWVDLEVKEVGDIFQALDNSNLGI